MSSPVVLLLLSAWVLFTCSSAQQSCSGRCGEEYFRGNKCQCDYECLSHKECCKDYASTCTSSDSCKGRCGESFKRGQLCHCDIDCIKYNQCCSDYQSYCNTEDASVEEGYNDLEVTPPLSNIPTDDGSNPSPYDTAEATEYDTTEAAEYQVPYLPDFGTLPSEAINMTINMTTKPPQDGFEPDKPQDGFEPEQIFPNNSVPNIPPTPTSLDANAQLPEEILTTTNLIDTTPASEETNLTAETTSPSTTETKSTDVYDNPETPASNSTSNNPQSLVELEQRPDNASVPTDMPSTGPNFTSASDESTTVNSQNSTEPKLTPLPTAQANDTDLEPLNPVQAEDIEDPEVKLGEAQVEPSENTTSGVQDLVSTGKPTTDDITEKQNETEDIKEIFSTKDSPTFPDFTKGTPASVTVSPSPTKTQEIPTKPKDANNNLPDRQDYQADANSDTNLCSGRPVNGLTTLSNGTVVVFRGHYFWTLDSRRNAGPAYLIRDVWGVPSPIDTVFTRCNCQGKTYILKGDKYWRFQNDVMDAGFPRPINEGFGLRGHITAALSMPQYRSRRESVFFFKTDGLAQRYTYVNTPGCGSRSAAVIVKKRFRKEAVSQLGQQIVISKTWVGFPSTVTSAVSIRTKGGDGYKYYVFSPTKYYSLKMEGDTPVILTPRAGQDQQKSAKSWFRCPEQDLTH